MEKNVAASGRREKIDAALMPPPPICDRLIAEMRTLVPQCGGHFLLDPIGRIRHAAPYHVTTRVRAKGRWLGRVFIEISSSELRHRPPRFYAEAMASGDLWIEGREEECVAAGKEMLKVADAAEVGGPLTEACMKLGPVVANTNAVMRHRYHVHELAAAARAPIVVLGVDPALGVVVVDKPAGLTVHPVGRHKKNTVLYLLKMWLRFVRSNKQASTSDEKVVEAAAEEPTARRRPPPQRKELAPERDWFPADPVEDDIVRCAEPHLEQLAADPNLGESILGAANRLDKATSGVLIFTTQRKVAHIVNDALAVKSDAAAALASVGITEDPEDDVAEASRGDEADGDSVAVGKMYVARVKGRFPATAAELSESVPSPIESITRVFPGRRTAHLVEQWLTNDKGISADAAHNLATLREQLSSHPAAIPNSEWIDVAAPIGMIDRRIWQFGVMPKLDGGSPVEAEEASASPTEGGEAGEGGGENAGDAVPKDAMTSIRLVGYLPSSGLDGADGELESLVVCVPHTGRTHQIRVHLSALGFPIADDRRYGGRDEPRGASNEFPIPEWSSYFDPGCATCTQTLTVRGVQEGDVGGGSDGVMLHAAMYRIPDARIVAVAPLPLWAAAPPS